MKPDWKTAPEWAKWLAMDDNGIWYWHEYKPEYRTIATAYSGNGQGGHGHDGWGARYDRKSGKWMIGKKQRAGIFPKDTLEPRPKDAQ